MYALHPENLHLEMANAIDSGAPVELFNADNPVRALEEIAAASISDQEKYHPGRKVPVQVAWLEAAAEKYLISPNFKDYVVVPVCIMPTDLPNRNLVAFSLDRITEFNLQTASLAYQTWRGRPTFLDHANSDHTQAKGVVLDVGVKPLRKFKGDIWGVNALCAFDRSKDPLIASSLLGGAMKNFSMGAMVNGYECSICSARTERPTAPPCAHVAPGRRRFNVVEREGRPHLAFYYVGPFTGFEVSVLTSSGAYPSTDDTEGIL